MFFFTRQKLHRVRHWQLGECDLMTLFSEWVSASTQAWKKERNSIFMWYVLSQDYQRNTSVWQCEATLNPLAFQLLSIVHCEQKQNMRSLWRSSGVWQSLHELYRILWMQIPCAKLQWFCPKEISRATSGNPLQSRTETILLMNILYFYSRTLLMTGILNDSKKLKPLVLLSFNLILIKYHNNLYSFKGIFSQM